MVSFERKVKYRKRWDTNTEATCSTSRLTFKAHLEIKNYTYQIPLKRQDCFRSAMHANQ